jgi:hypothetical protein
MKIYNVLGKKLEGFKKVLKDYYNSDFSRFIASLNYVKTMIYKVL